MNDWFVGEWLICLGCFVMFTGALGFFRFRDPFQRFHPTAKISILGLGLVILGEGVDFGLKTEDWQMRSFIALPLLVLLSPLAAHLMARTLLRKNSPN